MTADRRLIALECIAQARHAGRRALDEWTAKQVLAAYGIRTPRSAKVAADGSNVAAACARLAAPYVLKLMSPDVLHKSDVGGVRLGLRDADEVASAVALMGEAAAKVTSRLDGFLLEETAPAGHDVVVGGYKDPGFGPVVMFGLGGIFVEVLRDVSFRICPLTPTDAEEMIAELRGAPLLAGARGGLVVPRSGLVELLMRMAGPQGLITELYDELVEIDINPVIVSPAGDVAVDARMVLG